MNEHTHTDPLAELAALRQRLDNLEAEHGEFQRNASRRPVVPRKFLLTALAVVLVLAGGLLGQEATSLFIDPKGNVGIGTTSPDLPLVVGAPGGGPKIELNDIAKARWAFGTGNYMLHIMNDFLGGFWTDRLVISASGNVGIGALTSPDLPLVVGAPGGGPKIAISESDVNARWAFGFGHGDESLHIANDRPGPWTDRLVISQEGNVGVGTARPTARLSVDGSITATGNLTCANVVQEDWHPGVLENPWRNSGSGFNDPGYFKDSMGIVHLKGRVTAGDANTTLKAGTTIFRLPAGYHPIAQELFACLSNNIVGRVDVLKTGEVTLQAGSAVWVSLDGLTFRAESK